MYEEDTKGIRPIKFYEPWILLLFVKKLFPSRELTDTQNLSAIIYTLLAFTPFILFYAYETYCYWKKGNLSTGSVQKNLLFAWGVIVLLLIFYFVIIFK